jgi:hypothetical protein
MKIFFIRFIILFIFCSTAVLNTFAQSWQKQLDFDFVDEIFSTMPTINGEYLSVGAIRNINGDEKILVIRTNATGDTLWTKRYAGVGLAGEANHIIKSSDGNYLVAGNNNIITNNVKALVFKMKDDGDTLWTRNYGSSTTSSYGTKIAENSNGDLFIAGSEGELNRYPNMYIIKTNLTGDTLWTRTYGGLYQEESTGLIATSDGGCLVSGYNNPPTGIHAILLRYNASGDTLWTKVYPLSGNYTMTIPTDLVATHDSAYLMPCSSYVQQVGMYPGLIKVNSSGDTLWTRFYDTKFNTIWSIVETSDSNFVSTGISWDPTFSTSRPIIFKMNSSGDSLSTKYFTNEGFSYEIRVTNDGGYFLSGHAQVSLPNNHQDVYLVKESSGVTGTPAMNAAPFIAVYPNPSHSDITFEIPGYSGKNLTLSLTDILGREILKENIPDGKIILPHTNYRPGFYFYSIIMDNKVTFIGKIIFN